MSLKDRLSLLVRSGKDFVDDDCPTQAAALSYYAVFALPPLLLLILLLLGAFLDPQDVQGRLASQIGALMGPSAAGMTRTILQLARPPGHGALVPAVLGILALLLGATGAFVQLQAALNRAWEVKPDPEQGGIRSFLVKRIFSFGMILAIAFLLLVSLVLSAALSAMGDSLGAFLPGGVSALLLQVANQLLSLGMITLLFAAMLKVLPDARVAWRDVWVGAAATALLFVAGELLLGLYIGRSHPGEAFGAAGSLGVIFIWIYYSSMILLFGAEFTQAWAQHAGRDITPERGAVRVAEQRRYAGTEAVPA